MKIRSLKFYFLFFASLFLQKESFAFNDFFALNQQYKIAFSKFNKSNLTSYKDSFYIVLTSKNHKHFYGFNKDVFFKRDGDSITVENELYKHTKALEQSFLYRSRIKPFLFYFEMSPLYWKKEVIGDDEVRYANRFNNRCVKIIKYSDGTLRIEDVEHDDKFYVHDSTVYLVTAAIHENFDKINRTKLSTHLSKKTKCEESIPFKSSNDVLKSPQNSKLVFIYSYLGCPPCMLLKNELTKMAVEGFVDKNRIKVVNCKDSKEAIDKYILNKRVPFEYLGDGFTCEGGTFPLIVGYDNQGNLEWTDYGYDKKLLSKIKRYLE